MQFVNPHETQVVLVGGRVAEGNLTYGQIRALIALADESDDSEPHRLCAVASTDIVTNEDDEDERAHCVVAVGRFMLSAAANDGGPSGQVALPALRDAFGKVDQIPKSFWKRAAEITGDASLLSQPLAVHLVCTGPLCAGAVGYGVMMSPSAAKEIGVAEYHGQTQGFVDGGGDGDEDDDDEDGGGEDFEDALESQVPHEDGIAGWIEEVSMEGISHRVLALDDQAQALREAAAAALPGDKRFYLTARYD